MSVTYTVPLSTGRIPPYTSDDARKTMSQVVAEMPDDWKCSVERVLDVLSAGLASRIEERIQGDDSMRLAVIPISIEHEGYEHRDIRMFFLVDRNFDEDKTLFCVDAKHDEDLIAVNEDVYGPSWTIRKKWDRETEGCVFVMEEGARTAEQLCDKIISDFSVWLSQRDLHVMDSRIVRVFGPRRDNRLDTT